MTKFLTYRVFPIGIFALLFGAEGFSFNNDAKFLSRRDSFTSMLNSAILSFPFLILSSPTPTMAAADCSNDCTKNCKIIAPKVSVEASVVLDRSLLADLQPGFCCSH